MDIGTPHIATYSAIIDQFSVGGATLVLGDSKELCHHFAGQAKVIMSDPPYKLTSGGLAKPVTKAGKKHKIMGGMFSTDVYDNKGSLMDIPTWAEIAGVMSVIAATNCDAYVMANDKNIFKAEAAMEAEKWKLHNLLTWDKVFAVPCRFYMKHQEYVLYMWKGRARTINNRGSKQDFVQKPPRAEEKIHGTQKPVEVLDYYITNSCDKGEMVIDPYSGSASTLIAAGLAERRAIGFEINETHYENACLAMIDALG